MILRVLALAGAVAMSPVDGAVAACGVEITTGCLAEEIRAGLDAAGEDPTAPDRIRSFLARAELANGREDAALVLRDRIEAAGWRDNLVLPHARFLRENGRADEALAVLRGSVVNKAEGRDRFDVVAQAPDYAEEFAAAGDRPAARALLDRSADALASIPPNPMMLAATLSVAQAMAAIGEDERAEAIAREAHGWFADGLLELEPSAAIPLYAALARFDRSNRAEGEAREVADFFDESGPSAFNGAIWTGMAKGLQARGANADAVLTLAAKALDEAPERAAAAEVEVQLAPLLAKVGREDEARQRLRAAAGVAEGGDLATRAKVAVALAGAFVEIGGREEGRRLLDATMRAAEAEQNPMLRSLALPALPLYVRLGEADEALRLQRELFGRDGFFVANALIREGEYKRALDLIRTMPDDARFLMMAAIAEQLRYGRDTPPRTP